MLLHCPITWTLFGGDQHEVRIAQDIKRRVSRGEPVYVSKIVLRVIESLLPDQKTREIQVYDQTLYHFY